jgi:CheY-like chemotaxis protein
MSEGGEVNLPERSVKILLIDLNLMSHSAKRLKEMYFKVTTVSTSFEARKALSKNLKAEIILVDLDSVNMGDPTQTMTSGLALLRRLVMETSKNIPIIGLSSIDDKDLTKKIINAGAKEVLALPIHKSAREILLKNIRVYQHLKRSSLKETTMTSTSPISTQKKKKNEREGTQSGSIVPELELEGVAIASPKPSSPGFTSTLFSHANDVTKTFSPKNSHQNLTSQFDENAEVNALRSKNNSNLKQLEPRLDNVSDGQQKHSAVGTIHFMAPEVIFERRYGRSVDWWAW